MAHGHALSIVSSSVNPSRQSRERELDYTRSSMTRVAISQSNYIPWRGWFDMVRRADHFVLYEDVQYTRRDWRNRNRIKGHDGPFWLTIPVELGDRNEQMLRDTRVANNRWRAKHWNSIVHTYRKSPGFDRFETELKSLYLDNDDVMLSHINERFIRWTCGVLGIQTPITRSCDYDLVDGPTARLADLCTQLKATTYLSGPAAKDYLDRDRFADAGIEVEWMQYEGYPPYSQQGTPFEPGVSILDLLLNTGDDAREYMERREPTCNSPS
jgi:hypothetical protein